MKINIFSVILILSLVCCSRDVKNRGNNFTIATLKGPSAMGMIKLIDSLNIDTSNNIKVEILDEPMQVRKLMINDNVDFVVLPLTMASVLYNKGFDYRIIAVPVWGTLYLFGNDSTITSWNQLKNKRVNVMAKGMTPDILFRYLLAKNGLDPDNDILLDYSFPTHIELANAVVAGRAKLGVISEPLVSLVMKKNKSVKPIFDLNIEWSKFKGIPIAQTAFLGKSDVLKKNNKMVRKIIEAYNKSTIWVNRNPDSAAILIVRYDVLPDYDVAIEAIPRSNLNFVRASNIKEQINEYLSVFYEMNPDIIGGKMPDENFIY